MVDEAVGLPVVLVDVAVLVVGLVFERVFLGGSLVLIHMIRAGLGTWVDW